MTREIWNYRAELDRVVDGDTLDISADLGFDTYKIIRVRLKGVDTAEIFGVERDSDGYKRGMKQKRFVEDFLKVDGDWPITFVSMEREGKFGRWLGHGGRRRATHRSTYQRVARS